MQKRIFGVSLVILLFCAVNGQAQISPIAGVEPVMVDSATHDRFLGTYRSGNNISFYEPTTGNLLVTWYALASADPDRRRIMAATSSDGGATWAVSRNLNAGIGADMNASYPVAYGTSSTPIIAYYNSSVTGDNMSKEPIVATDLGGWGGGIWSNVSVDQTGTVDDPVDARYQSFAINPSDENVWLLGVARYAAEGNMVSIYRSTNAGALWSDPIDLASIRLSDTLNTNYVYTFTGNKQPPAMAFGANNKVYAVFQGQLNDASNIENAIFVESSDGGLTWSAPALIPGSENLMFGTADPYRTFSTLIDEAGNWHVFGMGVDTTEAPNSYHVWDFAYNGTTWAINKFVNPQLLDAGIVEPALSGGGKDEEDVMNSCALAPDGTIFYAYTDVYDTTGSGGDAFAWKYRVYVMYSEDNGTTWNGPQWVYEEDGWASEYPCEMSHNVSTNLHFFFRSGGGNYDEYKEVRYLGIPTLGVKALVTSVDDSGMSSIPSSYKLFQNFPNPFNPTTSIRFDLKESAHVKLTIYNVLGKQVASLLDQPMSAGEKGIVWYTEGIPTGTYFYQLEAGNYVEVKRMTLIK